MIEQTLMKFEKEHSDLMRGYDEYEPYWSLETEKARYLLENDQSVNFYARHCQFTTRSRWQKRVVIRHLSF
jgi:hypothetical protein